MPRLTPLTYDRLRRVDAERTDSRSPCTSSKRPSNISPRSRQALVYSPSSIFASDDEKSVEYPCLVDGCLVQKSIADAVVRRRKRPPCAVRQRVYDDERRHAVELAMRRGDEIMARIFSPTEPPASPLEAKNPDSPPAVPDPQSSGEAVAQQSQVKPMVKLAVPILTRKGMPANISAGLGTALSPRFERHELPPPDETVHLFKRQRAANNVSTTVGPCTPPPQRSTTLSATRKQISPETAAALLAVGAATAVNSKALRVCETFPIPL